MTSFLLVISFIIHFITLFTIIILYQKIKLADTIDPKQVDQMFQQYLNEIREENNRLQEQLQYRDTNRQETILSEEEFITEDELDYEPLLEPVEAEQDEVETSLTAKILSLAEKGYNENQIAKKLKCGKTEVELILKFYAEQDS